MPVSVHDACCSVVALHHSKHHARCPWSDSQQPANRGAAWGPGQQLNIYQRRHKHWVVIHICHVLAGCSYRGQGCRCCSLHEQAWQSQTPSLLLRHPTQRTGGSAAAILGDMSVQELAWPPLSER
jgi:hypothetical protein